MSDKQAVTKGIVRYLRPFGAFSDMMDKDNYVMASHNLGGVTFVIDVNHEAHTMDVKFAICQDDQNFNKQRGLQEANDAVREAIIQLPYDSDHPLISNIVYHLKKVKPGTNSRLRSLKTAVNKIIDHNDLFLKMVPF
jgi:hypothetical protein